MAEPLDDLRLSDSERTQALDALSSQYVEGRLDLPEFDQRSGTVTAATTFGELAPAFRGLPGGTPFVLGPDGRPRLRGDALPAPVDDTPERELAAVRRKGDLVRRVDYTAGAVAMVLFFVLMAAGVSFFWVVWPLFGAVAVLTRLGLGLGDSEEKAYDQVRKAEEADRAERLRIALERRRELDGPDR